MNTSSITIGLLAIAVAGIVIGAIGFLGVKDDTIAFQGDTLKEAEQKRKELEIRLANERSRANEAERKANEAEQKRKELEIRLANERSRANEAERKANEAEQKETTTSVGMDQRRTVAEEESETNDAGETEQIIPSPLQQSDKE